MEWQPIETAPRDSRRLLIACYSKNTDEWRVREAWWRMPYENAPSERCWWCYDGNHTMLDASVHGLGATHWMPLPAPPTGAAHEAERRGDGGVVDKTSIDEMCAILKAHMIVSAERTDCAIIYSVTFDQLRALYDLGRAAAPPPAGAAQPDEYDGNHVQNHCSECNEYESECSCAPGDDPRGYAAGGRESVDEALDIVESFGPGTDGVNDTIARQILLADEVKRLRAALAASPASESKEARLSKQQLIDYLANRRQALGGSISEHNHRRLLESQTRAELLVQYRRIVENEAVASPAPRERDTNQPNSDSAGRAYWEGKPGESLPHDRVVAEGPLAGCDAGQPPSPASSVAGEVKGEAVAWRYREKGESGWFFSTRDPSEWEPRPVQVDPLYLAAPSDEAQTSCERNGCDSYACVCEPLDGATHSDEARTGNGGNRPMDRSSAT